MISTSIAPNIEWHFKTDDKYTLIEFSGTLPEGMGAQKFVDTSFLGIIVRRVVEICAFTLTHLGFTLENLSITTIIKLIIIIIIIIIHEEITVYST